MSVTVIQISVKPDTPGEVGLPKMSVGQALVKKEGLEGDYNRSMRRLLRFYPTRRPRWQ